MNKWSVNAIHNSGPNGQPWSVMVVGSKPGLVGNLAWPMGIHDPPEWLVQWLAIVIHSIGLVATHGRPWWLLRNQTWSVMVLGPMAGHDWPWLLA